jgi:hypothetical protein
METKAASSVKISRCVTLEKYYKPKPYGLKSEVSAVLSASAIGGSIGELEGNTR